MTRPLEPTPQPTRSAPSDGIPHAAPGEQTKPERTPTYLALHAAALSRPTHPFEMAFVRMYDGWRQYAQDHARRFSSKIGEDYALGSEWAAIGKALIRLLNGDLGPRIYAGTMDATIRQTMRLNGCEPE